MANPSDSNVLALPSHPAAPRSTGVDCLSHTVSDTDDELPALTADTASTGPAVVDLPLEAIVVGERHRKSLRNIPDLAASIAQNGLLHPVVVTPDNRLIAGARRIAAFRQLGRTAIPAHVVPIEDIVAGEFAENVERDDFTRSEMVAIGRAVEPLLRAQAKKRQATAGPTKGKGKKASASGNLPEPIKGDARDHVANYCGVSGKTYEKAKAVVEAAEREPERFGPLVEEMDRTRRVDGAYRKLIVSQKAEAIRKEPPSLPGHGPYRVIVADPPWAYDKRPLDPSHRAAGPYPQMTIGEICALPVASIAHEDALLWLWATNAHMRAAFAVLDAWGFAHKAILTWDKVRMGTGDWLRGQTEPCLLAVRGKPTVQLTNQTTLLRAPAGKHSAKPDDFYSMVEALCPAPRYAELFQRRARPNWDGHGDEV